MSGPGALSVKEPIAKRELHQMMTMVITESLVPNQDIPRSLLGFSTADQTRVYCWHSQQWRRAFFSLLGNFIDSEES
ncbi:rCG63586 [Rattus norvegicus]|uniref:RCG63586 n=1 Tax=Rattus norvegicus TaxID=10116 RepID=A6I4I2_RAT|nr:rCG63586 [Rattus norvegicus]